jgi:ammonia channel protein AmtB
VKHPSPVRYHRLACWPNTTEWSTILGGFCLVALDKSISGAVAIIGALAALAGVFVYGRRREDLERRHKMDSLPKELRT